MSEVVVRPVSTWRQRKQFLKLPWTLHGTDPKWVAPLRDSQREMAGYAANPVCAGSRIQTFLAYRGPAVCGRIGAILNQAHIDGHNDLRGFFGFFEAPDDQAVADALLDAVRDWFARQGIYKLRGPAHPSLNHQAAPAQGAAAAGTAPGGLAYYGRLLEQYGLLKAPDVQPVYELDGDPAAAEAARRRKIIPLPGALEIRRVESRRQLDQFLAVPWPIYQDYPQWVPPLLLDQKEFLDRRKHPFYLHGDAAQFLALRGGVPCGRVLVSDDPRYNQEHGANTGCFGMFESRDEPETAHALLDAAAAWLRAKGRSSILGPIDYSLNYPCGLLVEGFHTPPRVMGNYNPAYYAGLLESWGLAKAKDLYSWWFTDSQDMMAQWHARAERIRRRGHIVIRSFQKSQFQQDVERCKTVYNGAMRDNWGFVSLTDAEFDHMAKRMSQLTEPELALLAEVEGQPVGFSVTLPDINEALAPLNGRLTRYGLPINLIRLLWAARRIKTARMVVLNVLANYRRRGIAEMLILRTLDYGKNTIGYTAAELGWTLEDNVLVNRTIEAVGGRRYKVHRIYAKDLGG